MIMPTSRDVFDLRKNGKLEDAYKLALKLNDVPSPDNWDKRALGWCLIDLIKRDSSHIPATVLNDYRHRLEHVHLTDEKDEIFEKQKAYALSLCDPGAKVCRCAQKFSKQKNYADAVNSYLKLHPNVPIQWHESFGWDIYKRCRELYTDNPDNSGLIRKYLFIYSNLKNPRPSLLHSVILTLAKNLAKVDKLKMSVFLQCWGLESFRSEDYEQNTSEDGKTFPSLVEESLKLAFKVAIHDKDINALRRLIPFLKSIIDRFSDNQWLSYYLGRALVMTGCREEALPYCRSICMANINDFWTWELLGDALADYPDQALACYSKGLLIPADELYTINLRIKTALLLAKLGYYPEAKREFETFVLLKPDKIPQSVQSQISANWYNDTIASSSNKNFFKSRAKTAEEILLANLPWRDAIAGYIFTVERDKGEQSRRGIYFLPAEEGSSPKEVSCKATSFPFRDLTPGTPIRIKGCYVQNGGFRILSFSLREEGQAWDIFKKQGGVILYVNDSKKLYHAVIEGPIDLTIPFRFFDERLKPGDFVLVKLFTNPKGYTRLLQAQKTGHAPGQQIFRRFEKETLRISGGPGFTDSDIFISPEMVAKYRLTEDLVVSGFATLNYERKKLRWSWRALDMDFYCE